MPPEMMLKIPGTSQTADMRGKDPMASAPPNLPMNQSPQYTTTTTARPYTRNSQAPTFLLTPFLGTCPEWQDRVAVRYGLLVRMVADEGRLNVTKSSDSNMVPMTK